MGQTRLTTKEKELLEMFRCIRNVQADGRYSEETCELQRNLMYLIRQTGDKKAGQLCELGSITMGSAYYDGLICGIRAGIQLSNTIIGL